MLDNVCSAGYGTDGTCMRGRQYFPILTPSTPHQSLRETATSGGVYEVMLEDLVAVVYESDATSLSSDTCPRAPRAALREDT